MLEAMYDIAISVGDILERDLEHTKSLLDSSITVGVENELPPGFEKWDKKTEQLFVALIVQDPVVIGLIKIRLFHGRGEALR